MLQDSARISAFALKADSKLTSGPTNRRVSDCKEIGNHVPSISGSLVHSACKNFHGLKWINYFFNWSFFLFITLEFPKDSINVSRTTTQDGYESLSLLPGTVIAINLGTRN
jgi:hypothetical protein